MYPGHLGDLGMLHLQKSPCLGCSHTATSGTAQPEATKKSAAKPLLQTSQNEYKIFYFNQLKTCFAKEAITLSEPTDTAGSRVDNVKEGG